MLAEKVYLSSGYLSFYFQKGNRNEPEPFYPGIPYGEGQRSFCAAQMKVAQVSEKVFLQCILFLSKLPGNITEESPESCRKEQVTMKKN